MHNPADDIRENNCPILAVFGEKDAHVRVDLNRLPLLRSLAEGKLS